MSVVMFGCQDLYLHKPLCVIKDEFNLCKFLINRDSSFLFQIASQDTQLNLEYLDVSIQYNSTIYMH